MKELLYLLPRTLGIIFIVFVSLFSLDIFDLGYGIWFTFGALMIHLIPSVILLVLLLIAWKKPRLGGWLYLASAVLFIGWYLFSISHKTAWVALNLTILAGPILIIGFIFLFQAWYYKKHHIQ